MAQEMSPFAAAAATETPRADGFWATLDQRLGRWSEWLNPILVKEARQAFKSNQFLITFLLLLGFGLVWSIIGVVAQMPEVQFGSGAGTLLAGYFLILVLPVLVIVPFSAFRSLAAEREDGTFEILSITTLSARQIVLGKLASAVLQLLVYYSALSPCIAFTYLLRGLDIVTIGIILFYTFLISVVLCCFSLLIATLTRSRHWQVLLSVALVLVLFVVGFFWTGFVMEGILWSFGAMPAHEPEFWPVNWTLATAAALICGLFVVIARGQISFASDNRAGPIRRMLLLHQVVALAWITYWQVAIQEEEYLMVMYFFAAIYWTLAGSLMVGESARLSPRVQRQLPQTGIGRMLFTWLNPGSGTGYLFAVANLLSILVYFILVGYVTSLVGKGRFSANGRWLTTISLTWCYVAIYMGIARLVLLAFQRWVRPNLFLALLLNILLALSGCAFPYLLELILNGFQSPDYTPLQFTNWMWTLYVAADKDIWNYPVVPIVLAVGAGLVVFLQMATMDQELWQSRASTPLRVVLDDQAQHPVASQTPQRSDPWDESERSG